MFKVLLGAAAGALFICALSAAAMAQSAYERYPDQRYQNQYPNDDRRYPSQNNYSSQTYPDQQYRDRYPAADAGLDQAYREGYRAGWWASRRGQRYDDRRPDSDYRYRR